MKTGLITAGLLGALAITTAHGATRLHPRSWPSGPSSAAPLRRQSGVSRSCCSMRCARLTSAMRRRNTTTSSGGPKEPTGEARTSPPTRSVATSFFTATRRLMDRSCSSCRAAAGGASFLGNFTDAWWVPLVDIGSNLGRTRGRAASIWCCPPTTKSQCRPAIFRCGPALPITSWASVPFSRAPPRRTCAPANGLVKQIKVYPLSKAANPAPTRFIDMTGVMYRSAAAL